MLVYQRVMGGNGKTKYIKGKTTEKNGKNFSIHKMNCLIENEYIKRKKNGKKTRKKHLSIHK